ncbi:MAG: hypothetical protein NTX86_05405 [Candidatus Dependentiae bacterium]|nr:hypothetical protein [Candidatus Dependentiae bacterium]
MLTRKCIIFIFLLCVLRIECVEFDVRAAALFPHAKLFRQIYGTASPSCQIEASCAIKDCLAAWSNLSYVHASGKSIPLKNKAKLDIVPLSIGLKFLYHLDNDWEVYTGAGLCYTWLKETINCHRSNNTSHIGGVVKLGASKHYRCLRVSLFGDYQLQKFVAKHSTYNQKVGAGGFLLGGALGVTF